MEDNKAIKEFIQSELIKDKSISANLKVTDNLIETGIIDSLGIQKLLAYLETTFSVQIADDELIPDNFQTIEAIFLFLKGKKREG
ncbi:acyl carrier protein [bacterium BMS3Abin10]|nr:acyl carrier protein [bacterium BMS3Abin10]GBE37515.1 acyl carrier protein [bacterium BMS3Bbin08]